MWATNLFRVRLGEVVGVVVVPFQVYSGYCGSKLFVVVVSVYVPEFSSVA